MAKILLVEDDKPTRKFYLSLLKGAGHEVDLAKDGEKGFAKAALGGYDLILLDIILPQKDGISFLEDLKKSPPREANKKIVMLTVLEQDEFVKAALRLGADGYLIKTSLTPGEFLSKVKSFLN